MTIGRSQIPEEIDAFELGGEVGSTESIDQQAQSLEDQLKLLDTYRSRYVPAYENKYQEYFTMLQPFVGERRRPSIYDLATQLSRGLAAQAASGQPPSVGMGLAYGFNNFSEAEEARKSKDEEALKTIQLKAAGMAIEDVKSGEKLFNELLTDQIIKDPSKLGNVEFFVRYGEDGKTIEATETAYQKDKQAIDDLLARGFQLRPTDPTTNIQLNERVQQKVEGEIMSDQWNAIKEDQQKSKLATINDQNLDKFAYLQQFIPESGLGKGAQYTEGLKEYLIDLPIVGDLIDEKGIGARQAIKNVQINFTLDIVGPYKGAISNKELDIFQASVASLANERSANDFILITSKRTNEIAKNYASAMSQKYQELYGDWLNGKINSAEVQNKMQEFRKQFSELEENKIFNEETKNALRQAGFDDRDIVDIPAGASQQTRDKIAKKRYIENLMKAGFSKEEAEIEANNVFQGLGELRSYRQDYINDYNNEISAEDSGFVDLG